MDVVTNVFFLECFNKNRNKRNIDMFYKDNVHKIKVGYQISESRSFTIMHKVVINIQGFIKNERVEDH